MKLLRHTFYYLSFLYLLGCASQSAPTGGPKDEDPPELLNSIPTNEQLNFASKTIELEFDEWIKLNNISKELIITPRINQEFEAKQKKNKVILEFEQPLDSNTTYTLYFREAIKDLNEGNIPPNLKLTFSTGSYLDSMNLSGNVFNLYTNKRTKDISIALYDATDTSEIFSDPPLYLSRTNAEGRFSLDNLKQGQYKLYVFQDNNNNLTLETSSEMYGFHNEVIVLDTLLSDFNIPIYFQNLDTLQLKSARPSGHYFDVKYNKYLTEYSIHPLDSTLSIYHNLTDVNKTIRIYNTFTDSINSIMSDSIGFVVVAQDSVDFIVSDTIYAKFEDTKRDKDIYKINIAINDIDYLNPEFEGKLNFSKPSKQFINDSLLLFIDSLTTVTFDSTDFTWNTTGTELQLSKIMSSDLFLPKEIIKERIQADSLPTTYDTLMSAIKPNLILGTAAFISVEQDSSTAQTQSLKQVKASSNTGIIKVQASTKYSNFTIQLLSNKNAIIQEMHSKDHLDQLFTFKNINAGEYKLRVLVDTNNNGIWDLGNMLLNTTPEPILYFETEESGELITLRANWEIGPLNFQF